MVCFPNHLYICHHLSARVLIQAALLTGILDAVLGQHAVAPIADTPNDLYAACPIRRPGVKCIIKVIFATSVPVQAVEALLEMPTNTMPMFTVWMAHDCFVWGSCDIVWEREPVVAT